ncbi:MAG: DUF1697 domain-containing protein [Propionibacteriales bacterium]|nr:DUF1697 domain-containing protein [Propionibacteriales bacterium]
MASRTDPYVVLLRGINVGGHAKLAMTQLREICSALGCTNVATYIQSGNVVLDSPLAPHALGEQLGEAIEEGAGFRPAVLVRTLDDLVETLLANPFPDADDRYLHIGFMDKAPTDTAIDALGEIDCSPEAFEIIGTEVFLHYVNGMGSSKKLVRVPFERRLGVTITARNLRTVRKLVELAGASHLRPVADVTEASSGRRRPRRDQNERRRRRQSSAAMTNANEMKNIIVPTTNS